MENRRNYYRILHIQPDAPPVLIRAMYRALMQKLKMHPDLGGSTWNAALINEAYSVLSDPLRRKNYDTTVLRNLLKRKTEEHVVRPPAPKYKRDHCLFCKTEFLEAPGKDQRDSCLECRSPLHAIGTPEAKIALRRAAARIEDPFEISYYTYWPQLPHHSIARNFSPTGIAIEGADHFFTGQLVKIESSLLRAVAEVRHQAPIGATTLMRVGLKFITVSFDVPRGTFIKVTV